MTLNESIVEDTTLEWFGEQCRVAQILIPAFSQQEMEEDGQVVPVGRSRAAIRWLNPAISEEGSASAIHSDRRVTIKRDLHVRFESRQNP